ncbi:hypothetical protein Tco_0231996 [Tanacetum coccineum]
MKGCKVIRTLASVEIEIMLILGLPCCLSSSSVRCLESSSRVPVPLPEDPYEAIKQAYLDGTDTESESFEHPVETETPESPLTIALPISLSESTPLFLVPILRRTARMAVRVPPAMSSSLSTSMAEKRYRGTSELVEDSEEDDDEEDEEIEESMNSDSVSKDVDDEGPTAEDEDLAVGDEGRGPRHGLEDEGHGVESDGLGLEEEEEAVPGGQHQAALVVRTAVSAPLGLGYGALRRRELALEEDQPTLTTWTDPEDGMVYIDVPAYPPPTPPVQTPPSPKWTSGSLPISPSPSVVPSPVSSPMMSLIVPSPIATPATAETELGAQVEIQGGLIRDHAVRLEELSPALFERVRAGAGRSNIWSDMETSVSPELQLVEERRTRLELAEVVDSMRRGQESRGDA